MADRRVTAARLDDHPDTRLALARGAVSGVSGVAAGVGEVPALRALPVCAALAGLLPEGALRGGVVVACEGRAAVSLAAAVVSAASVAGSWTAVLGLPEVGLAALAEAGVVLERVVCVADADAADTGAATVPWPEVLAAAVDGFELLVVGPALAGVAPAVVRRVLARAATRGAVVVAVDAPVFGADLQLGVADAEWRGLDRGHGVARERRATVRLSGRRVPRAREAVLQVPSPTGCLQQVVPDLREARAAIDDATRGQTDDTTDETAADAHVWRSAG